MGRDRPLVTVGEFFGLASCNAGATGLNRLGPEGDCIDRRKGLLMNYFVGFGLGTALGTLLVTGFFSNAHQFDWARALFVGLFSGLAAAGLTLLTRKKKRD